MCTKWKSANQEIVRSPEESILENNKRGMPANRGAETGASFADFTLGPGVTRQLMQIYY
jgi:hypothetical protein